MDLKFGTLYYLILETLETLKNLQGKLSVGLLKIVLVRYVLITRITLGMSISNIFGTSHSEVLCQIERLPILAGDLRMAPSALKIYSFFCVFNYMFLKEKCKKKIYFAIVKFNDFNPFVPSAPFLYPLKTSENLNVFWCFQGVAEWCLGIGFKFKLLNQLRCK